MASPRPYGLRHHRLLANMANEEWDPSAIKDGDNINETGEKGGGAAGKKAGDGQDKVSLPAQPRGLLREQLREQATPSFRTKQDRLTVTLSGPQTAPPPGAMAAQEGSGGTGYAAEAKAEEPAASAGSPASSPTSSPTTAMAASGADVSVSTSDAFDSTASGMAGSGADAPTSAPAQAAPLPERLVSLAREALGELDALGDALGDGQGVSIGMQGVRRQGSASGFVLGTERQQQLRDLLFKKDTMEALTASEFAMALDTSVLGNKEGAGSAEAGGGEAELRAMTRIDYDRLLRRLSSALASLDNGNAGRSIMSADELEGLRSRIMKMQLLLARRVRQSIQRSRNSDTMTRRAAAAASGDKKRGGQPADLPPQRTPVRLPSLTDVGDGFNNFFVWIDESLQVLINRQCLSWRLLAHALSPGPAISPPACELRHRVTEVSVGPVRRHR